MFSTYEFTALLVNIILLIIEKPSPHGKRPMIDLGYFNLFPYTDLTPCVHDKK